MIKNYVKITFRTIAKHKVFSFINILGLGLSMSFILVIVLFIKDQKSSDLFHENNEKIVRVYTTDSNLSWDVDGYASTPGMLGPYLLNNYNYFDKVTRIKMMRGSFIKDNTGLFVHGFYAEQSFFDIFSYELKEGNSKTALMDPFSIIISEEIALKFFGNGDPINKIMTLEDIGDFKVTGVLKTTDGKSHLDFETLISFSTLNSLVNTGIIENNINEWKSYLKYFTYVLLKDEVDLTSIDQELATIGNAVFHEEENENLGFGLQRLSAINLGMNLWQKMPNTMPRLDIIFIPYLAAIIMFLACFNYIIMAIARSLKRSREIGLRKVIGSNRGQIITLFLCETFIITFLALVTACLALILLIPILNRVDAIANNDMQINIDLMKNPGIYLIFLVVAVITSIVAGLYPAIYLSILKPINALQGNVRRFSNLLTRKILLGIQFTISLVVIIFIAYFYQLHIHWTKLERGIATENVVSIYMHDVNLQNFKNEIIRNSQLSKFSFSKTLPIYGGTYSIKMKTEKMEESWYANYNDIDPLFLENYDLELIAGRNFSYNHPSDTDNSIIINESTIVDFKLGSPQQAVNQSLLINDSIEVNIIGVVKNFHYKRFFKGPIQPFIFRYKPKNLRFVNVSYAPGHKAEVNEYLTSSWKHFDELHALNATFYDDAQSEDNENTSGTILLLTWASGFIILLALFGLLGMATYTTQMRVKEIGIRKVFGASTAIVTYVLSKSYLKIILISAIIALPGAYFLTDLIMQFTIYRPPMNLWVLPGALIFILILTMTTIGSQTVKAALANPTKAIQNE